MLEIPFYLAAMGKRLRRRALGLHCLLPSPPLHLTALACIAHASVVESNLNSFNGGVWANLFSDRVRQLLRLIKASTRTPRGGTIKCCASLPDERHRPVPSELNLVPVMISDFAMPSQT